MVALAANTRDVGWKFPLKADTRHPLVIDRRLVADSYVTDSRVSEISASWRTAGHATFVRLSRVVCAVGDHQPLGGGLGRIRALSRQSSAELIEPVRTSAIDRGVPLRGKNSGWTEYSGFSAATSYRRLHAANASYHNVQITAVNQHIAACLADSRAVAKRQAEGQRVWMGREASTALIRSPSACR